jgi:predicted transcriptional regulator
MSVKTQVLEAIHRLPDDANFRDVAEEIAFLAAVREAEEDIAHGRIITNEQMEVRLGEWTGS